MKEYECPGCGNIVPNTEKCCKYCGNNNPNYEAPKPRTVFGDAFGASQAPAATTPSAPEKQRFSVLVFLLLLIFFWPGAIIYAVLYYAKKK